MSVITISGQAGAGDEFIAERVADGLGYRLVGRPEVVGILAQYGIVEYEKLLDDPPHLFDGLAGEKESANELLNKLYLFFAKRNNVVIHSRRAFVSLEPFLNVFAIFLKAPLGVRTRYVMQQKDVSQEEAEQLIRKEEETRQSIVESFYKRSSDSMKPWTMVVDTHKLGMEKVIEIIVAANRPVAKADGLLGWQDGIPTTDTIETDPVMENVVDKVLGELTEASR